MMTLNKRFLTSSAPSIVSGVVYSLSCLAIVLAAPFSLDSEVIAQESSSVPTEVDPLVQALGGYHLDANIAELESLAGGQDALVTRLLELRTHEQPPFVGIRAAKLLLKEYSDRSEVQDALAADMESAERLGIARTIVANIDYVKNESARMVFAQKALQRAQRQKSFALYARSLRSSADERIQKLAQDAELN